MAITFIAYADRGNIDDDTGLPLYWSNSLGWVSENDATLLTQSEAAQATPPVGVDVVEVRVRAEFPIDLS